MPTIQWYRADTAQRANPVLINGASDVRYNSQPADLGKYIFAKVDEVISNVTGPITDYAISSITNNKITVLDFESLAVGNYSNYTDPQGNVWNPNGGTTFPIVQDGTRKGIQFTGTGLIALRNSNPALWKKLHDGTTNYTILFEGRVGNNANPNAVYGICGTSGAASSRTGLTVFWDDRLAQTRNNSFYVQIGRGVNGAAVIDTAIQNIINPNTPVSLVMKWNNSGTENLTTYSMRSKIGSVSKTANAPSTANATYDMEIGATGNGQVPFVGIIYRLIIFEGLLSDTDRIRLEAQRGTAVDIPAIDRQLYAILEDGRYNSFGTLATISPAKKIYSMRSGTNHTENGRVDLIDYDSMTKTWSNRRTIFSPSALQDIRDPRLGRMGDKLVVFFTVYDRDPISLNYNKVHPDGWGYMQSTDLTGNTWGPFLKLPRTRTNGTPWGKLMRGDAYGTFYQPFWKATNPQAGATFEIGYHLTVDNGYTWTDVLTHSGTDWHCTESWMVNCGGGKLFFIHRLENYWGQTGGLGQSYSTDNGVTWSAIARTNLGGTAANVPALYYDPKSDTMTCFYQNRTDGWLYVSTKNTFAQVTASPTAWNTPRKYEQNNLAPVGPATGLGYPDFDGQLAIWADEDSDSICKVYVREENFSGYN